MKPDKKYNIIIGILFFASLVGVFLPLIEISIVKISIFDVIKAAAGRDPSRKAVLQNQ